MTKKVFTPNGEMFWYFWIPCSVCTAYGIEDVTMCGKWIKFD